MASALSSRRGFVLAGFTLAGAVCSAGCSLAEGLTPLPEGERISLQLIHRLSPLCREVIPLTGESVRIELRCVVSDLSEWHTLAGRLGGRAGRVFACANRLEFDFDGHRVGLILETV